MKKILHFASSFPKDDNDLSGIFVKKLASYATRSFQCFVLAPDTVETRRCEITGNLHIVRFPYFIKKYQKLTYQDSILQNLHRSKFLFFQVPFFLFFAAFFLKKLVRAHSIDLVHAHWIFPQGFLAVMAREIAGFKCKILVTSHGSDIFALRSPIFRAIQKFALKKADAITAVSSSLQIKMKTDFHITKDIHVIPMGTDAGLFLKKTKRPVPDKYLLFVGRLDERKGLSYLIDAFSYVSRMEKKLKLVLIGSGHYKTKLFCLIHERQVVHQVIQIDYVPQSQLVPYYQHAEMLIGPSLSEGFGLVYVEAMLSRCPVIATKVGGTVDIIQNRKTGLLVEPGNASQIADAIRLLLHNRTMRQQLGANGFDYANSHFTWQAIEKKYTSLYQELL